MKATIHIDAQGREIAAPTPGTLEPLQRLIEQQDDVRRVLELKAIGGRRFRYLIETPFATFPRFVIGTTDALCNDVRIESKCGAEWNARQIWEEANR